MIDLLAFLAILAAWLLLSPCSRFSVWKGGSCAWRPADKPTHSHDQDTLPKP